MDLVSLEQNNFKERLIKLGTDNDDFSVFKDKPMLRVGATMIPLDLSILVDKFEAGSFWGKYERLSPRKANRYSTSGVNAPNAMSLLCLTKH